MISGELLADKRVFGLPLWIILPAGLILIASVFAFILLRSPSPPDSLAKCQELSAASSGEQFNCYQGYLSGLVATKGPTAALEKLDSLQRSEPYVHEHCHPLTHVVGEAAFDKYKDPEPALQFENGLCYTGYTHGVMERYMEKFDNSQLGAAFPTICHKDPSNPQSLKYYNCVHGIGHGIMLRFGDDVFKSLPYCDELQTQWEKSGCFNGIFMQNIVVDGNDHVSKDLKSDDPLYPCDIVEVRMKDGCYLIQGRHILDVTKHEVGPAFAWCDKVEADFINSCYQSIGTDINGYAEGDPAQIIKLCSQGNPDYQGYCYGSAAGDEAYRRQIPSDADPLCKAVPSRYTHDCREGQDAVRKMLQ